MSGQDITVQLAINLYCDYSGEDDWGALDIVERERWLELAAVAVEFLQIDGRDYAMEDDD